MEETRRIAPGRQGVTYEQVAAAANALVAAGERPTIRAVRARIGAGSPNTIQRHLDEWARGNTPAELAAATLPAEMQRLILAEMARAVATARTELKQQLADAQTNNEELTRENEEQGQELADLRSALEQAQAVIDKNAGAAEQLERALVSARQTAERERASAEAARQALAKAELRIEALPRLEADLESVRQAYVQRAKDLEACSAQRAGCEAKAAAQDGQIADLKARITALDKALTSERETGDRARSEAARLDAELAGVRATLGAAERDAAQARQDLGEIRAEALDARRQLLDMARGKGGNPGATAADKPARK